jgi:hypothetical protein
MKKKMFELDKFDYLINILTHILFGCVNCEPLPIKRCTLNYFIQIALIRHLTIRILHCSFIPSV